MWFGVLGPLVVRDDADGEIDLGGGRPRTMLATLLVSPGRPTPVDLLKDTMWGDDLPATASGTLQSYVSRIRKRLTGGVTLVHDGAGYRLDLAGSTVDHLELEGHLARARALAAAGELAGALDEHQAAAALWRGPAFGELADLEPIRGLAVRLDESRVVALEDRFDVELRMGRHHEVVGRLAEAVGEHPLRERLQHDLALALYRSGRQSDALRALAAASRTLRDELGIEPGRPLRDLEAAILAHDPALDVAEQPRPAGGVAGSPPDLGGPAARPRGASGPAAAAPATSTLVGRSGELAVLREALALAPGSGCFVVVEGDPGIGKTRLADELRQEAEARGAVAVWGRTDEGGAAPALWPWLAPLRALSAAEVALPDVLAELLDGRTPVEAGPGEAVLFARFEAMGELLVDAAAPGGVVVLLDDLQWADVASAELVAFLAGRDLPGVLVVVTTRPPELGRSDAVTDALAAVARRPGSRHVRLAGLDRASTAEVLRGSAGDEVADDVAAAIHGRSEGNPFFAIELGRLLAEEAVGVADVPATVSAVVRRRIARLPDATSALLGVAAVVGRDVDLNLLAATAGLDLDEVLDRLDPALAHRLLVGGTDATTVRFSHALVREVLLDDLTALRRARLHLRAAEAIEARGAGVDDAEIVAEHLWRAAAVGGGERAAEALERAADVAMGRVAYVTAEDLLTRAVGLRRSASTPHDGGLAELQAIYRLMMVGHLQRYFPNALDPALMDRAQELALRIGDDDLLFELRWYAWSRLSTRGLIVEASPLVAELVASVSDAPDLAMRAFGIQTDGVRLWQDGRIADAIGRFDEAHVLMQQGEEPSSPFQQELRAIIPLFELHSRGLNGMDADALYGRMAELIDATPEPFTRITICGFVIATGLPTGEWERVVPFLSVAEQADPELQFGFWSSFMRMARGVLTVHRGDLEEGVADFEAGRSRFLGLGATTGLPSYEAAMAIALVDAGDLARARPLAEAAAHRVATLGEMWNAGAVGIAEGRLLAADGDLDGARARLDAAAALADEQGAHAIAAWARRLRASLPA